MRSWGIRLSPAKSYTIRQWTTDATVNWNFCCCLWINHWSILWIRSRMWQSIESAERKGDSQCVRVCGNNVNDIFFSIFFFFYSLESRARACIQWTVWVLELIDGEDLEMLPLFFVWLPLVTTCIIYEITAATAETMATAHIFGCSIKTHTMNKRWATTSFHRSIIFAADWMCLCDRCAQRVNTLNAEGRVKWPQHLAKSIGKASG